MPASPVVGPYIDHQSHHREPHGYLWPYPDKLYVVTCMFDPLRWLSRYKHYEVFAKRVADANAVLYTIECAYGGREFEITDRNNPQHIQVRTTSELWLKERLLNIAISRLPADWNYVAWIDADVFIHKPYWAQETLNLLAHWDVIQMFSHAMDLGPNDEPIDSSMIPSFMWTHEQNRKLLHEPPDKKDENPLAYPYPYFQGVKKGPAWWYAHPGFAWAARRSAIDHLGGLIDWSILGSGDWLMANALVGTVNRALSVGYSERFKFLCRQWQDRAEKHIIHNPHGGVGCMPGLITHSWHGKKSNRMYDQRWKALVATGYDPDLDIKADSQGVWQLTDRSTALRDGIRDYSRARNEDSIEV